jgi:class 3 adenylate cyclase
MESHAPPGAIQVTERTQRRLAGRYEFERRDAVEIKGKSPMTTYLLLRRRAASPERARRRPQRDVAVAPLSPGPQPA